MDKLFLDASVLFSAAFRHDDALGQLWTLESAMLVTSNAVAEEARRNVRARAPACESTLDDLLSVLVMVDVVRTPFGGIMWAWPLPEERRTTVLTAIAAQATHLLTGDVRGLGLLRGQTVGGVQILTPSDYLQPKP